MTNPTSTTDSITRALATIARQAEMAKKRAEQIRGRFENRAATSFLYAIEAIRASELRELAEDAIYQELQASVATAQEMTDRGDLSAAQHFELAARFAARLASAARRPVETESSSFMANALAVARHNALLRVLESMEDAIAEARGEAQ